MRRARLIGILLLAVLVLAGCGSLTPVTEQGRDIQGLYNILFVAAAIWWAADLPNLWGPDPSIGLLLFALIGSTMILYKFRAAARGAAVNPARG